MKHNRMHDFACVTFKGLLKLELRTALRSQERDTMNVTTVKKSASSTNYPKCAALMATEVAASRGYRSSEAKSYRSSAHILLAWPPEVVGGWGLRFAQAPRYLSQNGNRTSITRRDSWYIHHQHQQATVV